jgi:hypothetical protein
LGGHHPPKTPLVYPFFTGIPINTLVQSPNTHNVS